MIIPQKDNSFHDKIVLVVEDHPFQRSMIVRMLHAIGVQEVFEAADGRQALALIENNASIDLMLCDLDMPEMDGMELIRHIGETKRSIAILISSEKSKSLLHSVEMMAKAYSVNIIGSIEKPLNPLLLKELITQYSFTNKSQCTPPIAQSFSLEEILHGIQQKQFEPFFQPQLNLTTSEIEGTEALARWRHPEHGVVSPYSFISTLEQSGNIDELTFLMLERTASACRNWHEHGFKIKASVNLSLVSLTDTKIADHITQIVRSTGLHPSRLILEITETASMTEIAPALENLSRLRMHGFGLAVDDYGTGFSNLKQLTRIPFTELKIDQSFITGCATDSALLSIVESSVNMAHRLNIRCIAEGVETRSEWEILKTIQCNIAQGYYISMPLEENLFLEFCAAKNHHFAIS